MEAVPRLHMLWFALKTSPEGTSFSSLKQYIAECYQEDPESYSKDVLALEVLRNLSMRPAKDMQGCTTLKRYYCQLHSLANRFPQISERAVFTFTWKDLYQSNVSEVTDLRYEMAAVLFNIAASHTQVGASVSRGDADGMKLACTHFQCAAWAFGELREKYAGVNNNCDFMTPELLVFMQQVSFGQAQECILEKSLIDNRKPNIVAKVTAQIVTYYGAALAALFTGGDDGPIGQVIDSSVYKLWRKYVKFKIGYLNCILFLYQGQHAEEQQKMGERLTLYQAAWEKLEEARKESKGLPDQKEIIESLSFTADVVEGKRKNAKSENEFIYHESVPELSEITAVQGANLVNGIGFSVTDPDVAGDDIFGRLVPMKAHEASSMYSEEKAKILREVGANIEKSDLELASYMSSLTLDNLNVSEEKANKIPQGIVDRCASLSANKAAIPDLIASMSHLAEICAEVETNLNEIRCILNEEEMNEKQFAQSSGVQRQNGHLTELTREFQKYSEAHQKAGESNDTLRKAMELHVNNLKILSKPLQEIQSSVPKLSGEFNSSEVFKDLKLILNKVNEMKAQRAQFHADLRIAVNNDDITTKVIAHGGDEGLQALFDAEIKKHDKQIELINANLNAQNNILSALTESYAKAAPVLKTLSDVKHKKDNFFSSLAASYDVYEDLLGKSAKGLEFYKKLSGNVQKLLARVRAAKDVQDEDRQQRMKSASAAIPQSSYNVPLTNTVKPSTTPKLKDYLKGQGVSTVSDASAPYIPSIRPNPLGSENPTAATCGTAPSIPNSNQIYQSQAVGPNEPPPPYSVNQYYDPAGYNNPIYQNTPAPPYEPQTYSQGYAIPQAAGEPLNTTPAQGGYSYQLPNQQQSQVGLQSGLYSQQPTQQPSMNMPQTSDQNQPTQYPTQYAIQQPALNMPQTSDQNQPAQYTAQYAIQQPALNMPQTSDQNQPIQYPAQYTTQQPSMNMPGVSDQTQQSQYTTQYAIQQPSLNMPQTSDQNQPTQYPTQYAIQQSSVNMPQTSDPTTLTTQYPAQYAIQQPSMNMPQTTDQNQPSQYPTQYTIQQPSMNMPQTSDPSSLPTQYPAQYTIQQPPLNMPQTTEQTQQAQYPIQLASQNQIPASTAGVNQSYQTFQQQNVSIPASAGTGSAVPFQQYQPYQQEQVAPNSIISQPSYQQQPQTLSSLPSNPIVAPTYTQQQQSVPTSILQNPTTTYVYQPQTVEAVATVSSPAPTQTPYYQNNPYPAPYNPEQTFQDPTQLQQYPSQPIPTLQATTQTVFSTMPVSQAGSMGHSYSTHPGYSFNANSGSYEYGSGYQVMPSAFGQYTSAVGQTGQVNSFTTDSGNTSKISAHDNDLPVVSHTTPQEQPTSGQAPTDLSNSSYYHPPYGYQSNDQSAVNAFGYSPIDPKHSTPMYTQQQSTIYMQSGNANSTQTITSDEYGPGATPPPSASITPRPSATVTPVAAQPEPIPAPVQTTKPPSNIDLLTDINFSSPVLPAPSLQPEIATTVAMQENPIEPISPTKQQAVLDLQAATSPPPSALESPIERKLSCDNLSICSDLSSLDHNLDWDSCSIRSDGSGVKSSPPQDPFADPKTLKYFHKEVERFEKTIESLNVQMLNGSTPLKSKWKEIHELLKKDSPKKTTSIAKLFPEKNRSNDSIPYDHARVVLETSTDDYINAAYVKDLGPGCPNFIIAQTPQLNTLNDFWSMIWSQKARTVVCLHTPNELLDPFWPQEVYTEMQFDDFSVKLIQIQNLSHVTEYNLKLSMNGNDAIIDLSLLQIKSWSKSSPTQLLGIAQNVLSGNKQRCEEFKSNSPVIMNCLTGSERSEQIAVAICAIQATQTKRPLLINIVDVWYRICNQRQNALKDTHSLELSMQIVLSHAHDVLNKRGIMTSYQMKTAQTVTAKEKEETKDPLNELDPLWKLKQK